MAGKFLYLEGKSGISGDMTVAALLDLGVDKTYFNAALHSLQLEDVRWEISRVDKNGIMACDFNVILTDEHGRHHEHASGHKHPHDAIHVPHNHGQVQQHHEHDSEHEHMLHDHTHQPDHKHEHEHTHTHGSHEHRNLQDVCAIIDKGELTARAKSLAKKILGLY